MSFNKITLVGNLGRDPELRYTPQGTPVCSFSLAVSTCFIGQVYDISQEISSVVSVNSPVQSNPAKDSPFLPRCERR